MDRSKKTSQMDHKKGVLIFLIIIIIHSITLLRCSIYSNFDIKKYDRVNKTVENKMINLLTYIENDLNKIIEWETTVQ